MNEKETEIVRLLRTNPFLSQQEMAEELNISRSTLANLISGLTRRGLITGRAYVLSDENEVVCIGGANVDRKFHIKETVQLGTSNPTTMSVTVGGVARNIAENLGRLGSPIRLLTVAGNDPDWEMIQSKSAAYMDLTAVGQQAGQATGSYSAVLSLDGELVLAMANMDVYDSLSPSYIEQNSRFLVNAKLIAIDLNCPKETVELVKNIAQQNNVDLAIIPVSSPKMVRMPTDLRGVTWFICNQDEAETYTGLQIDQKPDWENAVRQLLKLGAENVVITAGSAGVMAGSHVDHIQHFPVVESETVIDVTGAGDAFVSGVLHGHLTGEKLEVSIQYGLVNAAKTLQSDETVRLELSKEQLKNELEELQ